jgi:hypothetical protein
MTLVRDKKTVEGASGLSKGEQRGERRERNGS